MKRLQINKKAIRGISAFLIATVLSCGFAAGEYFGFDSYQEYLNHYYSQNASNAVLPTIPTTPSTQVAVTPKTIQPVTVFTPAVSTIPVEPRIATVPTQYYNGFASYEAYLNNYYATIGNPRTVAPANLAPMQTTSCLTVSDILKTDVEGQFLACDGTLYTVTRNEAAIAAAPKFLLNYSIQYQNLVQEPADFDPVRPAPTVYTPVHVYPDLTPKFETVDPVPAVDFNKVQALDFQVGNRYTFDSGLSLTVLEISDNRCFAGQYCARAGEVVARFTVEFRGEQNLLTVNMEPGEEPEINFLLANTSIKFTGINYDQISGQPLLQSVVQSR